MPEALTGCLTEKATQASIDKYLETGQLLSHRWDPAAIVPDDGTDWSHVDAIQRIEKIEVAGFRENCFPQPWSMRPAGMNVIYGPTGSGKTSLLAAMELAITGQMAHVPDGDAAELAHAIGLFYRNQKGQSKQMGKDRPWPFETLEAAWYGTVYGRSQHSLNRQFGRFNHLNMASAAAFALEAGQPMPGSAEVELFSRLLFGDEVIKMEKTWIRFRGAFEKRCKKLHSELEQLHELIIGQEQAMAVESCAVSADANMLPDERLQLEKEYAIRAEEIARFQQEQGDFQTLMARYQAVLTQYSEAKRWLLNPSIGEEFEKIQQEIADLLAQEAQEETEKRSQERTIGDKESALLEEAKERLQAFGREYLRYATNESTCPLCYAAYGSPEELRDHVFGQPRQTQEQANRKARIVELQNKVDLLKRMGITAEAMTKARNFTNDDPIYREYLQDCPEVTFEIYVQGCMDDLHVKIKSIEQSIGRLRQVQAAIQQNLAGEEAVHDLPTTEQHQEALQNYQQLQRERLKQYARVQQALEVLRSLPPLKQFTTAILTQLGEMIRDGFMRIHGADGFADLKNDRRGFCALRTDDGAKLTLRQMNPGQRTTLALSVLLSLHRLRPQVPRFLLLDEPAQHLNEEQMKNFVDMLMDVMNEGMQCFIATADPVFARHCWDKMQQFRGQTRFVRLPIHLQEA
ncbi:AAA family ATPase [Heliophilum fasciatum]|uniref:AAA family ATPase n=1 Tax=Heliophilum fasciatum TaxID=35700 RepID=UPI00140502D1|nr:AAA family ATPase [Heliophilum fasciatum]MCW2278684.1 energy-coupling factor transporter ATP-binding protein EcfA2 [Heliophilum fasciatum]